MARIDGEIVINRPVEEVFDFVADERNEPRYNPRMLSSEKLTPGPVGLGSQFRAAMRTRPRSISMTTEFTAFERPRRLALTTRLATMDIEGTLTFDPVPAGTRMRWSWQLRPRGLLKLLTPVVVRVGRRQEQTIWTDLKRLLEAREVPSPLRQVAAELSRPREPVAPTGHDNTGSAKTGTGRSGVPLGLAERLRTRLEHEVDTRSVRLGVGLLRLTKGRIARLWRRQVLVLTTRGRRSGEERTVPLQYFPDGEDLIVVAANSGLPSPPGWYFNLTADPRAKVEVGGRSLAVRAEELSAEEAAAFWPLVLQVAPDYARYLRRTSRRIRLLRLVPATLDHGLGYHPEAVGHG